MPKRDIEKYKALNLTFDVDTIDLDKTDDLKRWLRDALVELLELEKELKTEAFRRTII